MHVCCCPGYHRDGHQRDGYDSSSGLDIYGYDKQGYDGFGYDRWGFDREGFSSSGHDKEGYSRDGFNADGYNRCVVPARVEQWAVDRQLAWQHTLQGDAQHHCSVRQSTCRAVTHLIRRRPA